MDKTIGSLDQETTSRIMEDYEREPKNAVVRHALSRDQLSNIVFEPASTRPLAPSFSINVKTMDVANQKASGRCWIFAGLNVLREIVAGKCNIAKFELSQNYISLYDKVEKANFALENFIELKDKDHDDRTVWYLLAEPISDGGQWDMFVNLVKKYGLMPKDAFPETFQSNNTRETDVLVNNLIRNFAHQARTLHLEGKDAEIRPLKDKVMSKIYAMFLNSFGVPPTSFDFEYTDKDGAYHVERGMTPHSFYAKYIGEETLDEYQSIINSPTSDKPFMKNYTIAHLGNVVEGKKINHLNLTMDRIKQLIITQLSNGEPVWFGSDVGFYRDRSSFAWDDNALDYESAIGWKPEFDKEAMLDYRNSAMNHAMVITGVNLVNNVPTKWKIENSWGNENGVNGYYVMSDTWFTKFVYQAVIKKKYLTEAELAASSEEPTVLSPWDPMGTLAK